MFNINISNMAINYNNGFITTYKSFNEPYYNDLCYKIQLLQAFNMNKYDEFMLQQNIQKTYYSLREEEKIQKIINNLKFLKHFQKILIKKLKIYFIFKYYLVLTILIYFTNFYVFF